MYPYCPYCLLLSPTMIYCECTSVPICQKVHTFKQLPSPGQAQRDEIIKQKVIRSSGSLQAKLSSEEQEKHRLSEPGSGSLSTSYFIPYLSTSYVIPYYTFLLLTSYHTHTISPQFLPTPPIPTTPPKLGNMSSKPHLLSTYDCACVFPSCECLPLSFSG